MKFGTYLSQITGISIYPLISLMIFVVFFVLVTVWAFSIDKTEIERIEKIPFDN